MPRKNQVEHHDLEDMTPEERRAEKDRRRAAAGVADSVTLEVQDMETQQGASVPGEG